MQFERRKNLRDFFENLKEPSTPVTSSIDYTLVSMKKNWVSPTFLEQLFLAWGWNADSKKRKKIQALNNKSLLGWIHMVINFNDLAWVTFLQRKFSKTPGKRVYTVRVFRIVLTGISLLLLIVIKYSTHLWTTDLTVHLRNPGMDKLVGKKETAYS